MWGAILTILLFLGLLALINSSVATILMYLLLILVVAFIVTIIVQNRRPL
jgi:hypothetical protein